MNNFTKSSYIKNQYSKIFQSLIFLNQPKLCIELGVYSGYSSFVISDALKKNKIGKLISYDLFQDYKFNNEELNVVRKKLKKLKLEKHLFLKKKDSFQAHKNYKKNSVDFLHIDLSNTGDHVDYLLTKWNKIMKEGSIVVLEGGSILRDQIPWMKKYKKKSLNKSLIDNKIIKKNYTFVILHQYPSLTILSKNVKYSKKNYNNFGFKTSDNWYKYKDESLEIKLNK